MNKLKFRLKYAWTRVSTHHYRVKCRSEIDNESYQSGIQVLQETEHFIKVQNKHVHVWKDGWVKLCPFITRHQVSMLLKEI